MTKLMSVAIPETLRRERYPDLRINVTAPEAFLILRGSDPLLAQVLTFFLVGKKRSSVLVHAKGSNDLLFSLEI